jgi:hypothetical protein
MSLDTLGEMEEATQLFLVGRHWWSSWRKGGAVPLGEAGLPMW